MLTSLIGGDLGLLLNTGGAVLDGSGGVVIDTVGTVGGLAVISTERGAIGPRYGGCGNARTEWNLKGKKRNEPQVDRGESSKSLTVNVSGRTFPLRKTVNFTESARGRDRLANCPKM